LSAIEAMLERARAGLERVRPEDLDAELAGGALVVDIRPDQDRATDGVLPGAIVLERNVLEWRLDPTSPDAIQDVDAQRQVIIVCNEGYASSLAAATLRELGLARATDLDGGYRGWRAFISTGPTATDQTAVGSSPTSE
jgi:rhodanese-related sulfurtransferase